MRIIALACGAFAIAASMSQTAAAADTRTALSGQPIRIRFAYMVNPDCTPAGQVTIRLTQAPAHGFVTIRRAQANPNFPATNPRHACNGRKVAGVQVIYTSRPGYTGPDGFAIETFYSNGELRQRDYAIDVR